MYEIERKIVEEQKSQPQAQVKNVVASKASVECPVCQSTSYDVLYKPWQDVSDPKALYGAASGVRGTQQIVKCRDCEMIYENPRYPEATILSGYASSDEAGHDSQYLMRVESFYRALRRLRSFLPPAGGRVLDVGTAGGAFLDAAKRYGYDAYGLEPSEFLTTMGQKRGLQIHCGTIDNNPFRDQKFDLITLWDVIEHIVEPRLAVEKLRPLLNKDGILLLNYPDIGTLQAKMAGEKFWWILSGHLHYFTRQTIGKMLTKTGFEVVGYRRYWQTLQFGYLQDMAGQLGFPFSRQIKALTPQFIQKIPMSYYASQTTVMARLP